MNRIATRWLPPARVKHPFPAGTRRQNPRQEPQCGNSARWDLCGPPKRAVPTAIVHVARRGGPSKIAKNEIGLDNYQVRPGMPAASAPCRPRPCSRTRLAVTAHKSKKKDANTPNRRTRQRIHRERTNRKPSHPYKRLITLHPRPKSAELLELVHRDDRAINHGLLVLGAAAPGPRPPHTFPSGLHLQALLN